LKEKYSLEINYFLYKTNNARDLLIILKGKGPAAQGMSNNS